MFNTILNRFMWVFKFPYVLLGGHNADKNIYYHHATIQYVSSNISFLLSVRHNANKDT